MTLTAPYAALGLDDIPIFPLPRTVLFPGAHLPLHLFEPRYRRMIHDCLTSGPRAIAMALLERGWERDYEGRPPIRTVACVGAIREHVQNDDGTVDILLEGACRVSLDELPARGLPYRRARATVLPSAGEEHVDSAALAALVSAASGVVEVVRRGHPSFSLGLKSGTAAGAVVDRVADRLIADAWQRQRLLEEQDVPARLEAVTRLVVELLGVVQVEASGGRVVH